MTTTSNQVIINSPTAPEIQVNDLVVAWDGKRKLKGYVESKENGYFKMWNGPTFPLSHVTHFIQRKGEPFIKGTRALPTDIF